MRLIHLSDLHLGKRLDNYSLAEDQGYILSEILNIIDDQKPEAVLIAGDIYDKTVPPVEAVEMFDDFLVKLSKRGVQVYVISGNHDSPERLAFGERLMEVSGVHISPVYQGVVEPIQQKDSYGFVNIYMLPFVKPANVRRFFPDEEITSYTQAIKVAIDHMNVNTNERNVLIAHQFVTGAERSESEEISVGGLDNVDASVFEPFDYVALGHIHGPQNIMPGKIRYCGTPLKYSFSEEKHIKSVTVLELGEKGNVHVETIPLRPLRELRTLRGRFSELISRQFYEDTSYPSDYIRVILTDEEDVLEAMSRLRAIYTNIVRLKYDNTRTRHYAELEVMNEVEKRSPLSLFKEFYEQQNGMTLSEEQTSYIEDLIEGIWEEKQ